MAKTTDPSRIRSIVVHASDVVSAYEAVIRNATAVVLRVTAPYHGRMRARLHRIDHESTTGKIENLDIDPRVLIDPVRVPAYPEPAETEELIQNDPAVEYSTAVHHDRHRELIKQWRSEAKDCIVNQFHTETHHGSHVIEVKVLDGSSPV